MPPTSAIVIPHPSWSAVDGRVCVCTACVRRRAIYLRGMSNEQLTAAMEIGMTSPMEDSPLDAPMDPARIIESENLGAVYPTDDEEEQFICPDCIDCPNPACRCTTPFLNDAFGCACHGPEAETSSSDSESDTSTLAPVELLQQFTDAEYLAFESLLGLGEPGWFEDMENHPSRRHWDRFPPLQVPPTPFIDRSLSPVSIAVATPRGIKRPIVDLTDDSMPPPAPLRRTSTSRFARVDAEGITRHRPVQPGESSSQAIDLTQEE